MPKRYVYILMGLLFVSFFTAAFAAGGEDEDSGTAKKQVYHVFSDVDLIPTSNVQYDKYRIVVKSLYPKLVSATSDDVTDEFNNQVNNVIQTEATAFKNQIADNAVAQKKLAKKHVRNDLNVDFDTSVINSKESPILSIRFSFQQLSSGMARPYHYHRVLNFDYDTGTRLELRDLFISDSNYLQIISDYSRQALSKKLKDRQLILSGTEPTEDNFRNWNVGPNGLRITFDNPQVAAFIYGTQTVLIPYSALKEVLAPDSPLANCLKHRRRCFSESLLTGGFIDEAVNTSHRGFDPRLS